MFSSANSAGTKAESRNPLPQFYRTLVEMPAITRRMKMDKRTATDFVNRIEAHREKEAAIWQEMRARPDYAVHEDKSIESILDERENARALMESADASLAAFDWVDDGTGNFVPREEVKA